MKKFFIVLVLIVGLLAVPALAFAHSLAISTTQLEQQHALPQTPVQAPVTPTPPQAAQPMPAVPQQQFKPLPMPGMTQYTPLPDVSMPMVAIPPTQ